VKTGTAILLGVGITVTGVLCYLSFNYGKTKGATDCSELIAKIDSLNAIPPKVVTDTFVVHPDPEIKWRTRTVVDTFFMKGKSHPIRDSLVNEEVAIYVNDWVTGTLDSRMLGYKLFVPLEITIRDSIFTNVPVIVDRPVYKNTHGVYLGASIGGGSEFAYSLDAAYAMDKHQVGVQYLRYGGTNNWMVGYKYLIYQRK
jgi:hypothetical protein